MISSPLSTKHLLPLFLLLSTVSVNGKSLGFNYSTFFEEHEKDFITNNSYIILNAIQVTPDVTGAPISNLSGRILHHKPLKLWRGHQDHPVLASFNTTFVINIKPKIFPGGEGLAFILTGRSDNWPNNSYGPWLGIVNSTLDGNPANQIVAVEFDTKKSSDRDIDSNHVALDVNSIYSSYPQVSLGRYGVNLSAAEDITARVQYDGDNKNLSVFVRSNSTENLTMSVLIDLSVYLPETIYVGFSASTGDATELNCIKSWVFEILDVSNKPSNLLWVWILLGGGSAALLLCGLMFYYMRIIDRTEDDNLETQIQDVGPKKIRLAELKKATSNFSMKNVLGQGGFGTVYRGRLSNAIEVAVKRTSKKAQQGKQEFLSEVTIISDLNHKNLVKLLGWCHEGGELLLVYEYMPNGSLDRLIYEPGSILGFERRCGIVHGVAEAVDYLHHGCENRVLHRDIKASNVMLDSAFNARLGDFGLARRIQRKDWTHHSTVEIAGTLGYMAPESFLAGKATVEMDVYSFGVLVLKVVCGRRPGLDDPREDNNIVCWVWDLYRSGSILNAVDPTLVAGEEAVMCRMLLLGLGCCHPNPNNRPCMRTVLQILDGEAPPPVVPNERPAFTWPSVKDDLDLSIIADGQQTPITELFGR